MDAAGYGSGGRRIGAPSANRSCKERRQPAENSPAWKKGSSQGALAQPLSFLIMPSVFQLLGVGPRGWFGERGTGLAQW